MQRSVGMPAQEWCQSLERKVGYSFQNRGLLLRALTHRSRSREAENGGGDADNEPFEFLGDAILGFVATERLLARFPEASVGQLSRWKARLVSSANLFEVALSSGLGAHLQLGPGEERTGGREKTTILADALEALIAAVYLDGGIKAVRDFINRMILSDTALDAAARDDSPRDFKSPLQELLQGARLPLPVYDVVEERGPADARNFRVEVRVGETSFGAGQSTSKRAAEQMAAQRALDYFHANPPARVVSIGRSQNFRANPAARVVSIAKSQNGNGGRENISRQASVALSARNGVTAGAPRRISRFDDNQ